MDKINFNNVSFKNIWNIADDSWVHPAFQY